MPDPVQVQEDTFKQRRERFEQRLAAARRTGVPIMALRPDSEFPDELDDVVVLDCDVHFEAMSEREWWMACRFKNGEEVVFWFRRSTKPARISVTCSEKPSAWTDWDELWRESETKRRALSAF